jgi:GntR family transcriptional regulator, trigonelline degradation regulator
LKNSLHVVAPASLRELVAERIRAEIIAGRFTPGHRLIERELCESLGVSRTSVREALRELETEGLVTSLPNRGPIVSIVSLETAESIYQVRTLLEGLAARLFAERANDGQIKDLENAVDALDVVYRNFSAGSFIAAKANFYRVLLDGAGNEIASTMLKAIHTRVSQLRATSLSNPERAQASMSEIRSLLTAIKKRDADAAWSCCVQHIENAAKTALKILRDQQN